MNNQATKSVGSASGTSPSQARTLDLLSKWTRFRPSLCKGCWAGCCRLPVEITIRDLIRMGLANEDDATSSLKKLAKRLESLGIIKSFRSSSGLFTLAQKPQGGCIYLDPQNMCKIYEKRPEVCRRFPEIGPKPGYCPALHSQRPPL
jgi:Fe-S-cluster containining protein